jgi:hypothetical protein
LIKGSLPQKEIHEEVDDDDLDDDKVICFIVMALPIGKKFVSAEDDGAGQSSRRCNAQEKGGGSERRKIKGRQQKIGDTNIGDICNLIIDIDE